jgi:hypothetical protein
MKHIKKYNESTSNFTFIDIINIIQDIIDEGHDIVIYSATGNSYRPEDINRRGIETIFRFYRYANQGKKSFKIQISFDMSLEYNGLVDFFDEMKPVIARFEDTGFYLSRMEPKVNDESDLYSCYGVDYTFESD